jgi:hypothetical protein
MLTRLMIPSSAPDTLALTRRSCRALLPASARHEHSIKKLADDSLLRRILYKVEIPNPKPQEFLEVLYRVCEEKGIRVATGALEHAVRCLYSEPGLRVRTSYARDLMEMLMESASYDGGDAVLDTNSFDRVFRMFLATEGEEDQTRATRPGLRELGDSLARCSGLRLARRAACLPTRSVLFSAAERLRTRPRDACHARPGHSAPGAGTNSTGPHIRVKLRGPLA